MVAVPGDGVNLKLFGNTSIQFNDFDAKGSLTKRYDLFRLAAFRIEQSNKQSPFFNQHGRHLYSRVFYGQ
jgi:hypothetical protein